MKDNKVKKATTSKIILFFAYAFPIILLSIMIYLVAKEKNYYYLNYIEIAFVASLGISGYVTKWYMKKAALENIPKVKLGIMKDTYEYQKEHKDFEVYSSLQIKQDYKNIVDPLSDEEKSVYKGMINDNLDTKITS